MQQLRLVGTDVPRIEGPDKVTGASLYAVDVQLPGMLYARIFRSQVPHARLERLDASAARAVPGVHAVLTGADIGDLRMGVTIKDMPVLCTDRVRFVGDPIAAVAAETPERAEEAVSRIEVDYAELPAVFDVDAAMAEDAPIVHPDRGAYHGAPELPPITNLQGFNLIQKGDIEQGFATADRIFEH